MAAPINNSQVSRNTQTNLQTNTQTTQSNPVVTAAPTLVSHTKREELKTASLTGDLVAVAELLNDFPNIDEVLDIKTGTTALSAASENGQYDVVDVLLDAGAGEGQSGVRSLANSMLGAAKANENGILELLASKRQDNLANAVPVLRLWARKAENQAACNLLIAKYQGSGNAQPSTSSTSTTATAPTFITTTTTTSTGTNTTTYTTAATPTSTTSATNTSVAAPAPAAQAVVNFPDPVCTDDEVQIMFNLAKDGDNQLAAVKARLDEGMVAKKKSNSEQSLLGEAARKNQLETVKLILAHPTAVRISKEDKAAAITSSKFEKNGREIEKAIRDSQTEQILANTVQHRDIQKAEEAEEYYKQNPEFGNRKKTAADGGNSSRSDAMVVETMTSGFDLSHTPPAPANSSSSSSSSAAQPVVVTDAMKKTMNEAARGRDLDKIKQLLAQGMPMDTVLNEAGETVLSIAARKGFTGIVSHLMQNGARNLPRQFREHAILGAATERQEHAIRELLAGFSYPEQVIGRVFNAALAQENDFAAHFLQTFKL